MPVYRQDSRRLYFLASDTSIFFCWVNEIYHLSYRNVSVFDSLHDSCHANIYPALRHFLPPGDANLWDTLRPGETTIEVSYESSQPGVHCLMLLIPLRRISLISRS